MLRVVVLLCLAVLASAGAARAAGSVYVVNNGDNSVSQYDVGVNGGLVAKAPATVAAGSSPKSVAVSPDGKSVYVTNLGGVSQFDVGVGGGLSPKVPASVAAGDIPQQLAVSPDGKSVYVANGNGGTVSQYDVGGNGALAPKVPATVVSGNTPYGVAVSPDGKSVYVTSTLNAYVSQYDVGGGGALTAKVPATVATGTFQHGVVVSPDGTAAYVTNGLGSSVSQFHVGVGGGLAANAPATVAAGSSPEAVAVSPDGKSVYVTNSNTANPGQYTVSQYDVGADGGLVAKVPATVATGTTPFGVAVSPDGKSAYVTNNNASSVSQYDVGANGGLTAKPTASVASGSSPLGIAVLSGLPPAVGPPTAMISTPAGGATYEQGNVNVNAVYSCSPGANGGVLRAGAAGCSGTVPNGSLIDTTTLGSHTFTVTATDTDGQTNTTTNHYTVVVPVVVPVGPPATVITTPAAGANYMLNQVVRASYSCSPNAIGGVLKPGAAGCSGTVPNGTAIDTSSAGGHNFIVIATDTDGQYSSVSASYTVTSPSGRPSATITTPAAGVDYVLNQVVNASYSCLPGANGGVLKPGRAGCSADRANGSPIDTSTAGQHYLAVIATDTDGQSTETDSQYTVNAGVGSPTATITTPAPDATYVQGQVVHASFSCSPGANGGVLKPGMAGCSASVDGHGVIADGGLIDTASTGYLDFIVRAEDTDGQRSQPFVSIHVVATPPVRVTRAARFTFTPDSPCRDQNVVFDASASLLGLGNPTVQYKWGYASLTANDSTGNPTELNTTPLPRYTRAFGSTAERWEPGGRLRILRPPAAVTLYILNTGGTVIAHTQRTINFANPDEVVSIGYSANGSHYRITTGPCAGFIPALQTGQPVLHATTTHLHAGSFQVQIGCKDSPVGCVGVLDVLPFITTSRAHQATAHSPSKRIAKTLGGARFAIQAGGNTTITIRLNARGRELAQAHKLPRVTLRIRAFGPKGKITTTTSTVRFRTRH